VHDPAQLALIVRWEPAQHFGEYRLIAHPRRMRGAERGDVGAEAGGEAVMPRYF
jgi:hypothetical protein